MGIGAESIGIMLFLLLETLKQIQVNLANPIKNKDVRTMPKCLGCFLGTVLFITVVLPLNKDVFFVTTFQSKA
jgi:hypothetical protein